MLRDEPALADVEAREARADLRHEDGTDHDLGRLRVDAMRDALGVDPSRERTSAAAVEREDPHRESASMSLLTVSTSLSPRPESNNRTVFPSRFPAFPSRSSH